MMDKLKHTSSALCQYKMKLLRTRNNKAAKVLATCLSLGDNMSMSALHAFLAELFRGMLFKWKGENKKSHQK